MPIAYEPYSNVFQPLGRYWFKCEFIVLAALELKIACVSEPNSQAYSHSFKCVRLEVKTFFYKNTVIFKLYKREDSGFLVHNSWVIQENLELVFSFLPVWTNCHLCKCISYFSCRSPGLWPSNTFPSSTKHQAVDRFITARKLYI